MTGRIGPITWAELARAQPRRPAPQTHTPAGNAICARYRARAPETVALFREAAAIARVPDRWATSEDLHRILERESGGFVGRPNYTFGTLSTHPAMWTIVHAELILGLKTAKSTATGLGQLLVDNVEEYYPSGRRGIGKPIEEAVGMLRYNAARYGTPTLAWARYSRNHEGY